MTLLESLEASNGIESIGRQANFVISCITPFTGRYFASPLFLSLWAISCAMHILLQTRVGDTQIQAAQS